MRGNLCQCVAVMAQRQKVNGLLTENRCLVRIFLFLVAFASSWQVMIWILANSAMVAPDVNLADANDSIRDSVTPVYQSETSFHLDRTPINARSPVDVVKLDPVIRAVLSVGASDAHLRTAINCPGNQLLSIVVCSAPDHFVRRRTIRQTWGQRVKPIFFIGVTANRSLAADIEREMHQHGDIVQGTFADAYRNLTYKHVMALSWANAKCQSKFILKVDDDVYINVGRVVSYLNSLGEDPAEATAAIYCDVMKRARVKRSFRSKWRVTFAEFPLYYYPDYCSGWFIVYVRSTIAHLLRQIESVPYLWVDDVYVTGLLAQKAGVERKSIDHELLSLDWADWDVYGSRLHEKKEKLSKILFGPPQLTAEQMQRLWNLENFQ
jgi:Galactosyltransferase